jgi:signal transduction histidine kinase
LSLTTHFNISSARFLGQWLGAGSFKLPPKEDIMSILLVTGIEGARNCADVIGKNLGTKVEVAEGRKAALAALRRGEFAAVVVDETIAECDPAAAEAIWERAGLAIPVQVNFALTGAARLIRELRAALNRREREQALARKAAAAAIESELKSTVAGLLLHSELALSGSDADSPVAERLRVLADLAGTLRQKLSTPLPGRGEAVPAIH